MEARQNNRRMYLQELAILGLVRDGEAVPFNFYGKTIYKLKTENHWEKTPNFISPFPNTQPEHIKRTKIPQQEILQEIF